jgi:hypothetical protein
MSSPPSLLFDFTHPTGGQQAYNLQILVQLYDPSGSLPGAPGGGSGTVEAISTVFGDGTAITGGGHIAQVPEPSTLLLSCLGLTVLGGATWRRQRRNLAALLA